MGRDMGCRVFQPRYPSPALRLVVVTLVLASLPNFGTASESVVGGLEFRAAAGESACFDAGQIDGCPFQLTIKLTGDRDLRVAVNPGNLAEMQASVAELLARATEGEPVDNAITIRIPSARYGPGKYKGVLIFGNRGRSTTPEYCRGKYQPGNESNGLTGNVDIAEFTPTTLAGSFSAALFKRLEKVPGGGFRCNDKPVNASGRFRFSLPIRYDERYEIPMAEDDLTLAFGVATWMGGGVNRKGGPAQAPKPLPEPPVAVSTKSMGCDCSCPALINYDLAHPCRQSCGPQSRFDQCRPEGTDVAAKADGNNEQTDVCSRWEKIKSGTGVPAAMAPLIATLSLGGEINCEKMSAEEKAEFGQMLQMMLVQ